MFDWKEIATKNADHAAFAQIAVKSLNFHHDEAATTITQRHFSSVDCIHTVIVEIPLHYLLKEQGPGFRSIFGSSLSSHRSYTGNCR